MRRARSAFARQVACAGGAALRREGQKPVDAERSGGSNMRIFARRKYLEIGAIKRRHLISLCLFALSVENCGVAHPGVLYLSSSRRPCYRMASSAMS